MTVSLSVVNSMVSKRLEALGSSHRAITITIEIHANNCLALSGDRVLNLREALGCSFEV
jgi:hypothetical protein